MTYFPTGFADYDEAHELAEEGVLVVMFQAIEDGEPVIIEARSVSAGRDRFARDRDTNVRAQFIASFMRAEKQQARRIYGVELVI